jgi:hypothetical protein
MTQVSTPGATLLQRTGALRLVLHRETVSQLAGGGLEKHVERNPSKKTNCNTCYSCGYSCAGTCCSCGCNSAYPCTETCMTGMGP